MIVITKKTKVLLIASLLVLSLGLQVTNAKQTPETNEDAFRLVRDTVNAVVVILSDKTLEESEKQQQVFELIPKRINFESMSRRILATNWDKASDKQKQEFQDLFHEILLNTYWQRIKHYENERVDYITGSVDRDNYATVDTIIVTETVEIPISYRMERIDGL